MKPLSELGTPCLVLDQTRMGQNISRLQTRLDALGVQLNPHLKTAKSIEIGRLMVSPSGYCTVSTRAEAEYFAAAGMHRMIYAVGISPQKLPRIVGLRERGVDIAVILDSTEQARAVCAASIDAGAAIPA